jgi:hypothetical protein
MAEIAIEKRVSKNEDYSHNFRIVTEENQGFSESRGRSKSAIFGRDEVSYENADTIDLPNQSELERFKYITLNNTSYCITQLVEDLEWLVKTINFTKAFSEYLVYCTNQGFSESRGRSKSAIFGRDEVSYENPIETDHLILLEKTPFLKYKEGVKEKYRHLVYILKQLYKNALVLPDAEKVSLTISKDFNMESDIFLKNPEFIIDHFIYHIYSHNHIAENYEKVITILKIFEYLYDKTLNYVNELEFDILSVTTTDYVGTSVGVRG